MQQTSSRHNYADVWKNNYGLLQAYFGKELPITF